MTNDLLFSLPQPFIAIQASAKRFPVRRVWCVGRNYAAHARELGNDEKEPPLFFSKQPDMLVPGGGAIRYPSLTANYHYECELVVALKDGGENVSVTDAEKLIFGHAVGLDMTRRDLQKQMQEKGRPWEIGKSFEQSAPIGPLTPSSGPLPLAASACRSMARSSRTPMSANMMWNEAGNHFQAVAAGGIGGRRCDLHRDAGRRGRGEGGRPAVGGNRRPGAVVRHDRLSFARGCPGANMAG